MRILLLKICLAPLLITLCTLAARRFGHSVGGLIMGLPLTSGPVALILALQNGEPFAAEFSNGILLGLPLLALFGLCYARLATRFHWTASTILSWIAYGVVAWFLLLIDLPLVWTFSIAVIALALIISSFPNQTEAIVETTPTAWDIPIRAGIAVAIIFTLTHLSLHIGPHLSGIATTFPVYATVFAASTHRNHGPGATQLLLRGFLLGSFSYALFFLSIGLTIVDFGIPLSFGIGLILALSLQMLLYRTSMIREPIESEEPV